MFGVGSLQNQNVQPIDPAIDPKYGYGLKTNPNQNGKVYVDRYWVKTTGLKLVTGEDSSNVELGCINNQPKSAAQLVRE